MALLRLSSLKPTRLVTPTVSRPANSPMLTTRSVSETDVTRTTSTCRQLRARLHLKHPSTTIMSPNSEPFSYSDCETTIDYLSAVYPKYCICIIYVRFACLRHEHGEYSIAYFLTTKTISIIEYEHNYEDYNRDYFRR